ncbi:AraC family transcriptional regulator [Streptomyces sp. WMMC1477]|uniref:AraC family transcriptional regulator n=1 Tax=Streptomyces sp. WMMC1477 TaxID=3015155 RepID=UPI0022B66561|nr:AraC family transcriptional regulator [Streptomyces sp. WMMC1477]MCZ7431150.1 AraC family transcriptional regulator [Streptomyces sp. WMMC1477]
MDVLAELLDGTRARGGLFHQMIVSPPWSLRVQDGAPLSLYTLFHGTGWITPESGAPVRLDEGDIAVVRGPAPYVVADEPWEAARAPRLVIHPDDTCTAPDGTVLCAELALGVRTWGEGTDGEVHLVNGTYQLGGEVSGRLLAALPPVLVMRAEQWRCPLLPLLAEEIVKDAPGQQAVLDRLLDLLLIATLRAWFDRPDAEPPAWYRAQADPVVGPALRLLQADPARSWTVGGLAAAVGVSRAALARRFGELVGEPPMAYLTGWRMDLAADLLREPGATVGSVARRVGYANAFALSSAFKRHRGVTPSAHRSGTPAAVG